MSDAMQLTDRATRPRPGAAASRLFPATLGRFDDPDDRAVIDRLVRWIEARYRDDLQSRPSKHVYIRTLPPEAVSLIDRLRDSPLITGAILKAFPAGSVITPMRHTDELYLSHYNKDLGGDQGLFSKHYDGNLRFLPYGAVVRALIYLRSDDTYKVVFQDSGVERAFTDYEFGLLDFHRELHWVEGAYNPDDRQRTLLKCNYLIAPRNDGPAARAVLWANSAVFAFVKAAMEYSKSPRTLPQRGVGLLCNLFRVLNNIHPLVPFGFILGFLGAVGWGLAAILS